MEKILNEIPQNIKEKIIEIGEQDQELYSIILKKLIRLKITADTGNLKIWEKIQEEEENLLQILLGELSKQDKIEKLRKKLKSQNPSND
jgi:hypothetical protein